MTSRPLTFGVSITPTMDPQQVRLAAHADALALDVLAVQDHPYQPGHLEMWTFLAHLAARTSRISLMPDVADLSLRPPAMLAKSATTLDALTGGRLELAVGAGSIPEAIASMGGPQRTPAQSVEATAEALRVLRLGLDAAGTSRFAGKHFQTGGYQPGPAPAHPIGLWVGAQRPRLLRVVGELADGWVSPLNIYVPPEAVPAAQADIDRAALAVGRDPAAIRRIYNVIGTIDGHGRSGLNGSAAQWANVLADWGQRLGFDTFVFWPVDNPLDQLTRFAEDVVPRVRQLTAGE